MKTMKDWKDAKKGVFPKTHIRPFFETVAVSFGPLSLTDGVFHAFTAHQLNNPRALNMKLQNTEVMISHTDLVLHTSNHHSGVSVAFCSDCSSAFVRVPELDQTPLFGPESLPSVSFSKPWLVIAST